MREKFLNIINRVLIKKDIILIASILILFIFFFKQCNIISNFNKYKKLYEDNINALNDSVRIEKNKVNEISYAKKLLLTDKKNLESLNNELGLEIKKYKGKIISLEKIIANIKSDTIYIPTTISVYPDGVYSLDWKFDSVYSAGNYRKFSGNSFFSIDTTTNIINPGKTRINQDEIGFSFITGIRENNKALEIFITPKYPNMVITNIEGAIIDPAKSNVLKNMFPNKKWTVGPYIGIGVGTGIGLSGKPIAGPVFSIGICLNYVWIKF